MEFADMKGGRPAEPEKVKAEQFIKAVVVTSPNRKQYCTATVAPNTNIHHTYIWCVLRGSL